MNQIKPYLHNGAWTTAYHFLYESSIHAYESYQVTLQTLLDEEKALKEQGFDEDPQLLDSYIKHKTTELWDNCYRDSYSAILFGCMAIEGFINYYGSKRIGEDFFKRNIERIGITEKFSIIFLSCEGQVIPKNSDLLKNIRKLFDNRNRIIHPKTKAFNNDNIEQHITKHPRDIELDLYMEDLELVIDGICALDSEIDRDFTFKPPKKSHDST